MARALNAITSPESVKRDFPALSRLVHGKPVAYLDSAASAQKPQAVIDAMSRVMEQHYSNVHRGVYAFGAETSAAFEAAAIPFSAASIFACAAAGVIARRFLLCPESAENCEE